MTKAEKYREWLADHFTVLLQGKEAMNMPNGMTLTIRGERKMAEMEVKRESQVRERLSSLIVGVCRLIAVLDELEKRLQSVLVAKPPEVEEAKMLAEHGSCVPLADELRTVINSVLSLIRRTEDITNRIEL